MARSSTMLGLLMFVGCGGGGPGPGPEKELVEATCTLGALDAEGAYDLFDDADTAELILGFQGFLFLSTRISSTEMDECTAITSIEMAGVEPTGGSQPALAFSSGVSGELLFFLPTSNIASYIDQPATLAVRLEDDTHFCIATANVVLVDEDPCIHADDSDICGGTGGSGL